jgi:hypothetical protein
MLRVDVRSSKHTQASVRNNDHEADASEGPSQTVRDMEADT